jgi:hypothetical protein
VSEHALMLWMNTHESSTRTFQRKLPLLSKSFTVISFLRLKTGCPDYLTIKHFKTPLHPVIYLSNEGILWIYCGSIMNMHVTQALQSSYHGKYLIKMSLSRRRALKNCFDYRKKEAEPLRVEMILIHKKDLVKIGRSQIKQ